jgi:hypothetical protein
MPVYVPPEAFDMWLDCAKVDAEVASALIAPANDNLLEAYEISNAVNRVVNDSPELIAPAPELAPSSEAQQVAASAAPPRKAKKIKGSDDQPSLF